MNVDNRRPAPNQLETREPTTVTDCAQTLVLTTLHRAHRAHELQKGGEST
jgi:hypothetical protein